MRRFWRECRRVLAIPGLPMFPVVIGVVAGVDAHEGLPLDFLSALVSPVYSMVALVLTLVLMRRIPWVRRRMESKVHRRVRSRNPRTDDIE
jgi:hypothetical protein